MTPSAVVFGLGADMERAREAGDRSGRFLRGEREQRGIREAK
jgi:hypothetical protein